MRLSEQLAGLERGQRVPSTCPLASSLLNRRASQPQRYAEQVGPRDKWVVRGAALKYGLRRN